MSKYKSRLWGGYFVDVDVIKKGLLFTAITYTAFVVSLENGQKLYSTTKMTKVPNSWVVKVHK